MSDILALLALLVFVAVPSMMLWLVIDGLRTGVLRGRGGPLARSENPIGYWMAMAAYAAAVAMGIILLGTIAQYAWRFGWT